MSVPPLPSPPLPPPPKTRHNITGDACKEFKSVTMEFYHLIVHVLLSTWHVRDQADLKSLFVIIYADKAVFRLGLTITFASPVSLYLVLKPLDMITFSVTLS